LSFTILFERGLFGGHFFREVGVAASDNDDSDPRFGGVCGASVSIKGTRVCPRERSRFMKAGEGGCAGFWQFFPFN
jgi:hypothetical protein